ncbi:MAG: hypothetical protein R3E12_13850 [Candidatus Eisenbacteria bacterium]
MEAILGALHVHPVASDLQYFRPIEASGAWRTGDIPEADGVVVINGDRARIVGNTVSEALFNIWMCGSRGLATGNEASNGFLGFILCNVPAGAFALPDGSVVGSDIPAEHWVVVGNRSHDNLTTGILAIDGSNHNLISANECWSNGTYDIELAGDSERFGFFTPRCSNTTVLSAAFPETVIKNCGDDNRVVGGVLVDNEQDPCY